MGASSLVRNLTPAFSSLRPVMAILVLLALASSLGTIIAMMTVRALWDGSWGETSAYFQTSTRVTYPLVAGFAAAMGSFWRSRGADWLHVGAARSAWQVHGSLVAALWLAASIGVLLGVAPAVVVTAEYAQYGAPNVPAYITPVAGIVLPVALGYGLGRLMPVGVSAPGSTVLVYLALVYLDPFSSNVLLPLAGITVADDRERTFLAEIPWVTWLKSCFLVLAGLLALALLVRRLAGSRAWLALCAGILLAPLLWIGPGGMAVDQSARMPVCQPFNEAATGQLLCISRARDHARRELQRTFSQASTFLPEEFVIGEETLADDGATRDVDATFSPTVDGRLAHDPDRNEVLSSFLWLQFQSSPECASEPLASSAETIGEPRFIVHEYLFSTLIPDPGDSFVEPPPSTSQYRWVGEANTFKVKWLGMSDAEKQKFLRVNWKDIASCSL